MLDFNELSKNGQDLEQLIRELLFSLGHKVYWSGRGADAGKDLLCIEESKSIFLKTEKKWLIQCKHKAESGRSVGLSELDNVIDSCLQHNCDGYVLVTSSQPSSAVAQRLDEITKNNSTNIIATYWDSVEIERRLSTAQQWQIAQRFFPKSAGNWAIYSSDRPNHWTANFHGHYFYITNRLGSNCEVYLDEIERTIKCLDDYEMPSNHFLKLRSAYFDDKHGSFLWYIDYMHPYEEQPIGSAEQFEEAFSFSGGCNESYDFIVREYMNHSDHYDPNHYDFYDRYLGQFIMGTHRPRNMK